MRGGEDGLEQVVHELLHGALGGEEACEVDLGDHFVRSLVLARVGVVTHQVPQLLA